MNPMPPTPIQRRFLSLAAWSEGTSTNPLTKCDGYDVLVNSIHGPAIFTDFSCHPFEHGGSVQWRVDPPEFSTAAGRYQILARYWTTYKEELHLPNFSPASQDAVAIKMMAEHHALGAIFQKDIPLAIKLCSSIWASFPGNEYKQGGKSMDALMAYWETLA